MSEYENPILGIQADVKRRSRDVWQAEVRVAPGGNGGPPHRHLHQQERFRVLDGTVETLAVPPGTVHTFVNTGDADAVFLAEFTPALRIEEFFANLFGLALDGRTNAKGLPDPLQGAALLREFPQEFFYPPGVPAPVLRAAMAPLALAARLRGDRGTYPRYTERKVAA